MGELEILTSKEIRNSRVQRAVLEAVAAVSVLAVALVAPNAVQMLGKLFGYGKKKVQPSSIARARRRLVENGLLSYQGNLLRLTEKGERALRRMKYPKFSLPRPKRWDKKWRVIIFDISESRRPLRNKVRRTLISIGFVRLQDSVWVYPFSCEDFVTLFKADFRIGKEVLYLIVDQIENDANLRKHFGFATSR